MKTIVFIVPQISQPRCIKRINTIKNMGFPIKVYGFDNGLYSQNIENLPFEIHEVIKRKKDATKIQKIQFFVSVIRRIIGENKGNSIFYIFGFELMSIAFFNGCKHYIYEEADVTASYIKNKILRNFMKFIDVTIVKHSIYTIFTSEGFIKYLFPNKSCPNIILMPNKLNVYFDDIDKRKSIKKHAIDLNHVKFGFVGLIRFPNTIVRFARVVGKFYPNHEFHFYGDLEREYYVDEELRSCKNVFFHGPFKNPTDLPGIYQDIDVNVVCYDTSSIDVKIAEPNKLYESIYFETPIVVSKDTFLSEKVGDLKVGFSIDSSVDASIKNFIDGLNTLELNRIRSNMHNISYKDLVDNTNELQEKFMKI